MMNKIRAEDEQIAEQQRRNMYAQENDMIQPRAARQ
jgi:hypothetical protein